MRRNLQVQKWPRLLFAVACVVHVFFLVSLRTGTLDPLFNDSRHRFGPACDFFSIYQAGVRVNQGQPIYATGDQVEGVPYGYGFRYLPAVAHTVARGLAALPPVTAYALWLFLCELALMQNLRITRRLCRSQTRFYLGASLWLLYTPYVLELWVGQFTFITGSLAFWGVAGWLARPSVGAPGQGAATRPGWLADISFAAAVALKMMPLAFLPLAWALRRRRALCLALGGVLVSVPYLLASPADLSEFVAINLGSKPSWHAGNQGGVGLLLALAGGRMEVFAAWRPLWILVIAAPLAWLVLRLMRRVRAAGETPGARTQVLRDVAVAYTAVTCGYLLLYKDVWEHHYTLLLPAFALLFAARVPLRLWLPAWVWTALPTPFVFYDAPYAQPYFDPQGVWLPGVSVLHHAWKCAGVIFLLAALVAAEAQTRRGAAATRRSRPVRLRRVSAVAAVVALLALGTVVARASADQAHVFARLRRTQAADVRQTTARTCGPAALATLCQYRGIPATEAEIARLAGTTARGTSMWGLLRAAEQKGLAAEACRLTLGELRHAPKPALLFLRPGHFVLVTETGTDGVTVLDPSIGKRRLTPDELQRQWRGETLLVRD